MIGLAPTTPRETTRDPRERADGPPPSPAQPDYPAQSLPMLQPSAGPASGPPASSPSLSRRDKLRQDPTFHTAWAVHPVAEYDGRCRPGPWLQFRLPDGWEWNRVELPVPNLPRALEGLRILHVSDFHLR